MKYAKINIIHNIANFKFYDNHILYTRGDGLRNKRLYLDKNDLNIKGVAGYFYFNEKILYNKWSTPEKSYILNIGDNIINEINNQRVQGFISNIIIYRSSNEDFYFYKNSSFEDLFSSFNYLEVIKDDYGITSNYQNISKVSFNNETLWHYSLSSLGKIPYNGKNDEIDNILGIAHDNLWFNTKSGRLISLDVETGEVTKKYSYLQEDEKLGYELTPGFGRIFLHEEDNNLYALGADYFHVINTKNSSIEEQYKHSFSDPKGMGKYAIYSPLLQGNYFTFIAADQNSGRLRFLGLFDIHKKQLVWEHELFNANEDNELIAPEPLYMSGNKLYVKDFKANLHIFERQD